MTSVKGEKSAQQISTIRKALPQILAVGVKNVLLLGFGMTLGFPTILIPSLSGGNAEEKIALGQEAISWIGSVNYLCVPLGCLLSGVITQPLGRRRAMQMVNLPFLAAWLLFHFSTEAWQVFLALCMTGFSGGLLEAPTLTYLAEVTTPNLRGVLASTSTVAVISGILAEFLLGTFLHWRTVALVSMVLPLISCILLFFVPESPYWLISKNRFQDAQISIAWLRGWISVADVEKEFKELCDQIEKSSSHRSTQVLPSPNTDTGAKLRIKQIKDNFTLYTKKSFLWPFGLVSLTFGIGHFSGMTTLQTYAVNIFSTLKAPINKYYATIILGIAEALGCILSSFLVHFLGKRKMNFFSLIGTGISFCIVATYAYTINVTDIQTQGITKENESIYLDNQTWIPMTFLIGAAFFSHSGIRILPWMLIGEVYYSDIRASASGFSGAMSYILGFISNKIFFSMISAFTLPGTFWFYSCICTIGVILLYFVLPETEGKTLFDITEHFAGRNILTNKVSNFLKRRKHKKKGGLKDAKVQNLGKSNIGFESDDKCNCDTSSNIDIIL